MQSAATPDDIWIYVLSNSDPEIPGPIRVVKLGKTCGRQDQLVARYRTSLPFARLHYYNNFYQQGGAIEDDIKDARFEARIRSLITNSFSEWFRMTPDAMIQVIQETASRFPTITTEPIPIRLNDPLPEEIIPQCTYYNCKEPVTKSKTGSKFTSRCFLHNQEHLRINRAWKKRKRMINSKTTTTTTTTTATTTMVEQLAFPPLSRLPSRDSEVPQL